MSKHHSKAKINKKIGAEVAAREERIINIIFFEFMKCIRPKPRFFPQKLWTWLVTTFVFDLRRSEALTPDRAKEVFEEVQRVVSPPDLEFRTNGTDEVKKYVQP